MEIQDRTFLVTGGASGLGRAAAQAILAAGGNAVLLDVNADTGRAAETALGAHARFAQADVTNEEQVAAAVELAHSSFGGLHGVINAAGIGPAAKDAIPALRAIGTADAAKAIELIDDQKR